MGLGADLLETFELGSGFTILRDAGNVTGQYADLEVNSQVTKPFIREFFLEAFLPYNTSAVAGDYVQMTDGRIFIVMNKTPEIFEDEAIGHGVVLYKCNKAGTLYRPSNLNRSTNYVKTTTWSSVRANCSALCTEGLYGNSLEMDEALGQIGLSEHELYLPHSIGVQPLDRYQTVFAIQ